MTPHDHNGQHITNNTCPFCQLGQSIQQDGDNGGYIRFTLNEDLLIVRVRPDTDSEQITVTFDVNFCHVCGRQLYDAPIGLSTIFEPLHWTDPHGSEITLDYDGSEFVLTGTPPGSDPHEIIRHPSFSVALDLADRMAFENHWEQV